MLFRDARKNNMWILDCRVPVDRTAAQVDLDLTADPRIQFSSRILVGIACKGKRGKSPARELILAEDSLVQGIFPAYAYIDLFDVGIRSFENPQ